MNLTCSAEMYADAGNKAVDRMLFKIEAWTESGRVTRETLVETLTKQMKLVAKTHAEINDTEPEWYIVDRINELCAEYTWASISRDDLF